MWTYTNIGARVDIEDKEGNTSLHVAARHGHASVVKTLIAYGANMFKSVLSLSLSLSLSLLCLLLFLTDVELVVCCLCTWHA